MAINAEKSGSEIKFHCIVNEMTAELTMFPPNDTDLIDWSCKLFDTDGREQRLVELGEFQFVTKHESVYAVWDRITCTSTTTDGIQIGNTPLTDVQKHLRATREPL